MANQLKLDQPIVSGSLRVTHFFNGRLVTGADLTREQNARREAVSRLGQAAGEGIADGLKVEKDNSAENEPLISVSSGLAVNRCGQCLYLAQNASINLLKRFGAVEQASKIFSNCQPLAIGTYAAGYGLYLLVLSPAEASEGSAPTSGLNNAFSGCNTDVILETVQFRLLAIDPFLTGETAPNQGHLRNHIAYRCFGTAETRKFYADPFGLTLDSYGLIDEMRKKTLTKSDVPLAIVNWTSGGIQFVEAWAVRRRLTKRSDDEDWTQFIGDRRASESEAVMRQFADQIADSQPETNDFRQIRAVDYFRYLPPAGILPLANSGESAGFNLQNFFGDRELDDIAMLEGERLPLLLREAAAHEPIDLLSNEKIQLYFVRENFQAAQTGQVKQLSLVFAKRTIPYCGTARFDEALSKWNLSRFV